MDTEWECVVVGGGAAGLSAALVLGRARRRALVVDAGTQSNLAAHAVGGLLGHDGRPPAQLYETGLVELAGYPTVEVRHGEVVKGDSDGAGFFVLALADGTRERTRRVLLASGMEYRIPQLPGLAELWGSSAFHCPFCHGWELRDQPLSVLASGDRAVHMALMLRGWTDDVVVLTNGDPIDTNQLGLLTAAGVGVDERTVAEFISFAGELTTVAFTDGGRLARRGVLVASSLHQRSGLAAHLGIETAPPNPVSEDAVKVDAFHRTSVPGVFAAGDLSAQLPQVAAAVASGSMAAAAVVQSLLADEFGLPVPPWPIERADADAHA